MVDNVNDQPKEPVNKVLPRPRLALQTAFQEMAVNFGENHSYYTPLLSSQHLAR